MSTEKKSKNSTASSFLRKRYIKSKEREASLEIERVNAYVATKIYEMRKAAGLSQGELAELVETTQSVISRLEDTDYDGHSIKVLERVADALKARVKVDLVKDDPEKQTARAAFRLLMRNLRMSKNLKIEDLANKLDLDREELHTLETRDDYTPEPYTLHELGKFYGIPQEKLLVLAGAVEKIPDSFQESASRFAAQSESLSKLSADEKKTLDEFVKFLKSNKA